MSYDRGGKRAAQLKAVRLPEGVSTALTEIKLATFMDIESILELLRMQFMEHGIEVDTNHLRDSIIHILNHAELGAILLAMKETHFLGCAVLSFTWTLEHGGKSAWLDELYVVPDQRNKGIGENLLDSALLEAKKQGCVAVDLEVDEGHRRAENLYRRNEFQPLARKRWVKRLR